MARKNLLMRALHLGHLVTRPMTLGVRVAAFDAGGRIFLVRHTYVPGWYMPGGGIDPGETAEAAARREMREEGDLEFGGALRLVSIHYNRSASKRDHVVFYRADGVVQTAPKTPDREIAESGFFHPDALPEATTDATRRRLAEVLGTAAPDPYW